MIVATPDDMARLGARIAAHVRAGDLVLLSGELGAGKTTLTRGIGEALGVRGAVTSPTFVLARTHPRVASGAAGLPGSAGSAPGLAPLVHVDAYRLSSALELDDLDIDFPGSIVVIEWGDGLIDGLTDDWLRVRIDRPHGGDPTAEVEPRIVTLEGHGQRWEGWVRAAGN